MSKYKPLSNDEDGEDILTSTSSNTKNNNPFEEEDEAEDVDLTTTTNNNSNSNSNNNELEQNNNEPNENTGLIHQEVEEEDDEGETDLEDFSNMIIAILKPVTITMFLVVWAIRSINGPSSALNSYIGGNSMVLVYSESSDDSTGQKIWGSLLNGLVFLVVIVLTTVAFVLLYKYRCLKAIYAWLFLSVGILLGSMGSYVFMAMLSANNLALDYVTFIFIMFNFSVGGIISVFWYAPVIMNQGYLVIISTLMAISISRLPDWTTWVILSVVSIYDLFAVLCPRGPLKVLVETAQERNETIPALIYNANFEPPSRPESSAPAQQPRQRNNENNEFAQNDAQEVDDLDIPPIEDLDEEPEKRSLKLGLGDFVFYSVLMGRAAMFDMSTVFTCFVAIITGLFATLFLLAIFKKALPALPISIAFGILFYFLTRIFLYPFIETIGAVEVFI